MYLFVDNFDLCPCTCYTTLVHYEYIRTLTQMEVKMLNNLRWHATIYIATLAPHAVMHYSFVT